MEQVNELHMQVAELNERFEYGREYDIQDVDKSSDHGELALLFG
jgi:hypothetical protein